MKRSSDGKGDINDLGEAQEADLRLTATIPLPYIYRNGVHTGEIEHLKEELRLASWRSMQSKDGGQAASIDALQQIIAFMERFDCSPAGLSVLAIIAESIKVAGRGGQTALFLSRAEQTPSVRSRRDDVAWSRLYAAAILEAMILNGEPLDQAAAKVARGVAGWSLLKAAQLSASTIKDWRKAARRPNYRWADQFDQIAAEISKASSGDLHIPILFRRGPPGLPGVG